MFKNYELWSKLTFKTVGYRKNFDLTFQNENFVTDHTGTITELRYNEDKPPFLVGEFGLSIWNIGFAKTFGINLIKDLKEKDDDIYNELVSLVRNGKLDLTGVNRLVLIHNIILHPKYRKMGIVDEFFEFIYRDYGYGENNKIIALVKPIQQNIVETDFYFNSEKSKVKIREIVGEDSPYEMIPAKKYYKLDSFLNCDDVELNEYKLFAIAARCGLKRIDESYLFDLEPDRILKRLNVKRNEYNKTLL